MYELVNTSLPNGLIPGTHGFATVALTKGTPDTLRMRFESFCAYKHRTGVHDATYFKENPVNWFHVILPQGEHVVGRVAPVDFDYTGRTNRLAHLLVFSKGEMPAIGGASVLQKEYNRFVAPWSGVARWLESDKLTPGRLRLEMPSKHADAPAWRAMFGEGNGLNLAKGFARQLAKNMSSGGRMIYFKTSTAHDVDGTKILALFTDLIDLLPFTDRQKVTFSTYPVALPQGTVCHLRGVYDRDRIFDAAAATQPWVDCEKGFVHNASLLPAEEVNRVKAEMKQTTLAKPLSPRQDYGVEITPRQEPIWIPPKKDETKNLFIGILIAALVLVAGAIGVGTWLYFEQARKMRESGAADALHVKAEREAEERRNQEAKQKTEEKRKRQTADDAAKKDSQEAARKPAQGTKGKSRQEEKDHKREKTLKEQEAGAKDQREKEERDKEVVFTKVKRIEVLNDGDLIKAKFLGKEKIMTNGSIRAYWYAKNGVLTNAPAEFKLFRNPTVKAEQWNFQSPSGIQDTSGNLIIWLDVRENVAYWDWTPLYRKAEAWFAKTNKIDLAELCFGKDPLVYGTWEKKKGKPRFVINADGDLDVTQVVEGNVLMLDRLVNYYYEKARSKEKKLVNAPKNHCNEYSEQKKKAEEGKKKYEQLDKDRRKADNRIREIGGMSAKESEKYKEELKTKRKVRSDVEDAIDKLWEEAKEYKSFFAVSLKYNNHKIEGWDELLQKYTEIIEKLSQEQKPKEDSNVSKENVRVDLQKRIFRINKVEGIK